jgi:hypothetical protein
MASISEPARRDGRNRPHRPRSRSKYTRSLPGRDVILVESGVAVDLFAQLRVPTRPRLPVLKVCGPPRQGRVRGAHRIVLERPSSSCGKECCKQVR